MTFYLGGSNLTSQPYFGSSLISKIYKGASLLWEYLVGGDAYEATNSLFIADGDYLARTPTVTGDRKTFTFSAWVKRDTITSGQRHIFDTTSTGEYIGGSFNSSDQVVFRQFNGSTTWQLITNETITDAQWHHFVFTCDTTQATEADRLKIYIDGVEATYASASYPALNTNTLDNTVGRGQAVGWRTGSNSLNGYIADVHRIDGQALDPTSFAESSAVYGWQPKEYSGSYGTNGFHLKFIYANKPGADIRGSNDYTWNGTGSIEGFGPTGVAVEDPYFNNVSLLLHMNGTNGGTTFTDSSANSFTQSANSASLSTSDSAYGTASGDFTADGATVKFANDPAFRFGTQDFTIEGWFKPDVAGNERFWCGLDKNTADGFLLAVSSTQVRFRAGGTNDLIASVTIGTTGFTHVAFVRSGTTRSIYVDGTLAASGTLSFDITDSTNPLVIGSIDTVSSATFRYSGYIDEVRITKGVARYTSDFVPQNAPFADSAVDPYFNNVSLLLPMDGTNGSTTFTDSSNNSYAPTVYGDAQISTTASKFGGASGYFDGVGDYLQYTGTSELALGAGDFTVEFWFNLSSATGQGSLGEQGILGCHTVAGSRWTVRLQGTSTKLMSWWLNTPNSNTVGSTAIQFNTWYHVALVRSGSGTNNIKLYLDGVLESQGTDTYTVPVNDIVVGRTYTDLNGEYFNGYIDDVRITPGVARYTSDFTPPFGPNSTVTPSTADPYINNVSLLLHMDGTNGSTTFTDSSSNSFTQSANSAALTTSDLKFGTAGGDFTTNGHTVKFANDSAFRFGTGDFTIEGWFKPTGTGSGKSVCGLGTNTSDGFTLFLSTSQAIFRANGTNDLTVSLSLSNSSYTHVAWVRNGNTRSIYVDGTLVGSDTLSFDVSNTANPFALGSLDTSGSSFRYIGYIDEFRVTKGVARYTANFTPQNAPFEDAVTDGYFDDVVLLLHGDGTDGSTTITDDSVSVKTVTANGSSVISTTQSKFGGSSLYFPGATADYMSVPNSTDFDFGSGDLTIEAWVYIDGNSSASTSGNRTATVCNTWNPGSSSISGWNFLISGDATTTGTSLQLASWSGGDATRLTANTTISQQVWHHVAATVEGGTRRLFLDGTLLSGTTDTVGAGYTEVNSIGESLKVGATLNTGYPLPLNGYIDDLRITKGVARYTADFTPPTAPFPNS